jgi:hypothetical protein
MRANLIHAQMSTLSSQPKANPSAPPKSLTPCMVSPGVARAGETIKGGGVPTEWRPARRAQIDRDGRWTLKRGKKRLVEACGE